MILLALLQTLAAHASPRIGVVAIDVQKTFVSGAANENMPQVLANIKRVFQLAGRQSLPFLITYEASESGDHALATELKDSLPQGARDFVKTTFDATGQPAFAAAVKELGLTHVVLLGSETDVCVLQTAQGLRRLGVQVLLDKDAVFSSEPNVAPAWQRYGMEGVSLLAQTEIENILEGRNVAPTLAPAPSTILGRDVAVVLNLVDDEHLGSTTDPFRAQKLERLRELLLLADWLELPTFSATQFSLPSSLAAITSSRAKKLLEQLTVRPLSQLPASVSQVFVAGVATDLPSFGTATVFPLQDAVLGATTGPLTYKSLFYGLTKSINPAEWSDPRWAERDSIFGRMMTAPEELSPIR